jgi:hypothetical protein
MEKGFAASSFKPRDLSIRWIHQTERWRQHKDETMKRRLLRLTGRWVESNGDGFRCLNEEDARPFSVMDSSHAKEMLLPR